MLWIVLMLDAFSMLVTGYTTPFSIILTVANCKPVAVQRRLLRGRSTRTIRGPDGLDAGLQDVAFHQVSAAREEVADTPETGQYAAGATSSLWRTARRWT
ncbi:hypothetical protein SALBM311S_04679 [Streptomyces alboniger]